MAQPCLDYLAPEYALTLSQSPASDMFSLGMLILAVHNSGQPLNNNNGDWNCYKRNACAVRLVAKHFWYICLLGRAIAGLSYGWFIAIRHKLKLPTYIQELLVKGRRGYLQSFKGENG
jgi:hypothetical protein